MSLSFGFGIGDFLVAIELANKLRKEFIDAPAQFKAISDEVRSLSIVLQDTDIAFSDRELNNKQKEDLEDIDKSCRAVLNELQGILDKYSELDSDSWGVGKRARIKRVWKRLKWKPEDIEELRGRISSNISLLTNFNGRLTRDNMAKLVKHQEDRENQKIINWITPIDYAPQHKDFLTRRQEGTGQWLLDSEEFQEWLKTDKQTLFCPGIPGAGKTILTSIVIQHLLGKRESSAKNGANIGVAYLYCNFRRQDEQRVEDLLANLLKQLAQTQFPLPGIVKDLYYKYQRERTQPSIGEISKTLNSIVTAYSRIYIVLDALDECQEKCRTTFLSYIFDLQSKTGTKLFVTSRPNLQIEREFKGHLIHEILASDEDVRRYLEGHMSQLPAFVLSKPKLQEEIKSEITRAAEGMFLLAQLYLGSLEDKITAKAIKTSLKQFTKHSQGSTEDMKLEVLIEAYKTAMERIKGQKEGFQLLANQVLSWIICARRPLLTIELQHALAVELNESELDKDNIPELDAMVSVCAGLVTIDEESNIIRLVHYTTQEYFERTRNYWFPTAETEITTTCITYLSFDIFGSGACRTDEESKERQRLNPFFKYAAQNWGHHARSTISTSTIALNQTVIAFLQCQDKVEAASEWLLKGKHDESANKNKSHNIPRMTGLHVVSFFGIETLFQAIVATGNIHIDSKDGSGRTPLSWAARKGHTALVKLILGTEKVDIDIQDNYGCTPLWLAAGRGHEAVVKLLLDTGKVNINSQDCYYRTPFWLAAVKGHEAIVKSLLDTGKTDINFRDKDFCHQPLFLAASNRHEVIFKLLLDTGDFDVNFRNRSGRTVLMLAAEIGHEDIVKLLLNTSDIDIDPTNDYNQTPLLLATINGHEAIVKLLLDTGKVEVDWADDYRQTPLLCAIESKHEAIVKLLLDTGKADVNWTDHGDQTPLSWAAKRGYEAIVELLLNTGNVDINWKDLGNHTPLSRAAKGGHVAVAKLLLERGAKTNIQGNQPLHVASYGGHDAVVKLLIDNGADINAASRPSYYEMNRDYENAIQAACQGGNEAVVKMLLDRGAGINADGELDGKALQLASHNGREEVVKLLLNSRGKINAHDGLYGSALQGALSKGHDGVAQLLLNPGFQVNFDDNTGLSPLFWAARNGYTATFEMLLATNKFDINSKETRFGNTAIFGLLSLGMRRL